MKVDFLGFQGNRQNHQDWALEIIAETNFEKSFFSALFRSDRFVPKNRGLKQMQPVAALLYKEEEGITIMVSAENFCESPLVKAKQRILELEKALSKAEAKNV